MKKIDEIRNVLHKQISTSKWPGYVYCYPHKKAYRLKNNIDIGQIWAKPVSELNLYIHIPFCESRCAYCNLFTLPIGKCGKADNTNYVNNYIQAVLRQIKYYKRFFNSPKILSLYFGGGTPNYLSIEQLERIFSSLKSAFPNWDDEIEPCIECSPYLFDKLYIEGLKKIGFRRISMGMQSFDGNDLKIMNRYSEPTTLLEMYNLVKCVGLNTNVDIIYGLPNQNVEAMLKNLDMVISLSPKPENISFYPLVVRKLTGMDTINQSKSISGDEKYKFFNIACKMLTDNGYQWESSVRFSFIGGNSTYKQQTLEFQGICTLGIGSGARSYAQTTNYVQPYKVQPKPTREVLDTYINANFETGIPFEVFHFNNDELKRKFIIFSFLKAKLSIVRYYNKFGEYPENSYSDAFQVLHELQLIEKTGEWLVLTDKGKRYHDIVVNLFESEKVKQLKKAYNLE